MSPSYGLVRDLPQLSFADAVGKITAALKEEGFGVISEIDVRAKLLEKIDHDMGHEYLILGACAPKTAKEAIEADPFIGLLLPCNVLVASKKGGPGVTISAIKPSALFALMEGEGLEAFASHVEASLQRALDRL